MTKRVLALLLVVFTLISVAGCKNSGDEYSYYESEIVITEEGTDPAESKTTTTTTTTQTNQNTTTANGKATSVANLDFGGKTIKVAITNDRTPADSDKRMFAEFESKYNCKLSYDIIDFSNYLNTLASKLAGNQPYDIAYFHGSFFPTSVVKRLFQPLDDAIANEDKFDAFNPSKGGIDMSKTDYYLWNGKRYGVAGQNDIFVPVLFYNKQKFKDAGLSDPLELYNSGKWTWDEFKSMGQKVSNPAKNVYFCDASINGFVVYAHGGNYVKYNSPKDVKENTADPKIFKGLKFLQEITNGQNKIINTSVGNSADPSELLAGNTYMYCSEDIRFSATIAPQILDKKKLGGKLDNIGFVPLPLDSGVKAYPGCWVQGVGAMRGSKDIRYAVAFAYFRANWKDSKTDKYTYPTDAQAMINKLKSAPDTEPQRYGYDTNDGTGNSSVIRRIQMINSEVVSGNDIKKTLDKYKGSIQNAIDVTLKKQ